MENKEYAGFWIRFGALLIDLVIMMIVLYVPLSLIYGEEYWVGDKLIYGFWDVMLGYVVPFVATIWFWLHYLGTPGKMAMKLQIVDASTGGKMRTGQAIGRYFAYIWLAPSLSAIQAKNPFNLKTAFNAGTRCCPVCFGSVNLSFFRS